MHSIYKNFYIKYLCILCPPYWRTLFPRLTVVTDIPNSPAISRWLLPALRRRSIVIRSAISVSSPGVKRSSRISDRSFWSLIRQSILVIVSIDSLGCMIRCIIKVIQWLYKFWEILQIKINNSYPTFFKIFFLASSSSRPSGSARRSRRSLVEVVIRTFSNMIS